MSCTLWVQDKLHLYFLFDLMPGGDLMDVLVAEARVIKRRIAQGTWKRACFAPKVRSLAPLYVHAQGFPLGRGQGEIAFGLCIVLVGRGWESERCRNWGGA